MKARTASKILHHAWVFHGFSELLTSLVENDVFTLRAACRSSPVSCAACLSWPLPQPLVLAWLIWGKCHLTRVTPLAMGGWGNAIMLRPINCYLLRQTDEKNDCLLCYVATICFCHDLSQTHGKSHQNFFPIIFQMFFCLFCTGLHLNYVFYPYWPLNCVFHCCLSPTSWPTLTSDPRHQRSVFPIFPQKQIPADWQQFVKDSDLLPIKHFESLQAQMCSALLLAIENVANKVAGECLYHMWMKAW